MNKIETRGKVAVYAKDLVSACTYLQMIKDKTQAEYFGDSETASAIEGDYAHCMTEFVVFGEWITSILESANEWDIGSEAVVKAISGVVFEYFEYNRYENLLHKHIVSFKKNSLGRFAIHDRKIELFCSARNRIDYGFEKPCGLDKSLESLKRLDLTVFPRKVSEKLEKFDDSDWLLLANTLRFSKDGSEKFYEDTEEFWVYHREKISDFCDVFNVSKEEGDDVTRFMNTILLLENKNCEDFYPLRQEYTGLYPYEAAAHLIRRMPMVGMAWEIWEDIKNEYIHYENSDKIRKMISLIFQKRDL